MFLSKHKISLLAVKGVEQEVQECEFYKWTATNSATKKLGNLELYVNYVASTVYFYAPAKANGMLF